MLSTFLRWLSPKSKKKLIIVDGDSCLRDTWVYEDILGSSEVYIVRHTQEGFNQPKLIAKYPEIIDVPLIGYRTSKETVDKYIAMMIQKAVSDGYKDISVISRDCDMVDIGKMAIDSNDGKKFKISIVMPDQKTLAKGTDIRSYEVDGRTLCVYLVKRSLVKREALCE